MRRAASVLICLLLAPGLWAASPFALDPQGVLWKGASSAEGLVLTGEHNGQTIVTSVVPYIVGINGSEDRDIQVAADDLTGKVVVTWQRHYAEGFSQIMLAVWKDGSWERVEALTNDFTLDSRFPATRPFRSSFATATSTSCGGKAAARPSTAPMPSSASRRPPRTPTV
ncbi:MAG: hypothetical protein MUF10_12905 [Thermoanaerobaculaceae bacterium]|nr:hypothetical protein [Thermoanaerobaculaceae bacterium]